MYIDNSQADNTFGEPCCITPRIIPHAWRSNQPSKQRAKERGGTVLKEICKSPPKLRMRDASHVAAMLDAWTDYVDAKCNLLRRCISPSAPIF